MVLCVFPFLSNAQPGGFAPEKLSDDELIGMQVRDIVSWLKLNDETKDRFIKEYTSFRKEIDAVARGAAAPVAAESEADIDKALQKNFEVSEKILDIRKKYYSRFKAFMQPSQIRDMYRIENESGKRMQGNPPMPPRSGQPAPAPAPAPGPGGFNGPSGPGFFEPRP